MTEKAEREAKETRRADSSSLGRAYVEQMLASLTGNWTASLAEFKENIDRLVSTICEPMLVAGQQVARIAPYLQEAESLRELNDLLAPHGWFIPPSVDAEMRSAIRKLMVEEEDSRGAVATLVEHCDGELSQRIVDRACDCWAMKDRASLLRDALLAHKEGKYTLSVPVLLSQTEGAYVGWLTAVGERPRTPFDCKEVKRLESIAGILTLSEMMLYVCLCAFSRAIPEQLAASVNSPAALAAQKRRFPLGFLSRHAILHGIDKDYGTRENSSKALFVIDVVRELFSNFEPRPSS